MKLEQVTKNVVGGMVRELEGTIASATALDQAAQALAASIYDTFSESVVLARVFVTVPVENLPASNKEFVQNLAKGAGAAEGLSTNTPVLSLLGTYGQQDNWRDRRQSQGHVGIPLISADFVGAIPMISRLLKELGVPLDWVISHDVDMIVQTLGDEVGLFFVESASDVVDQQGRKVIAAQDFVISNSIQSVFGCGGAYANGQIVVLVVFCRDRLTRGAAETFLPLCSDFKLHTGALVDNGQIFSD